jgi:SAM-dependent methyltransferase
MRALLPQFLDRINARFLVPAKGLSRKTLVDLGCGTGRNTILLVDTLSSDAGAGQFEIVGLDASSGMLDVARATIQKHVGSDNPRTNVSLEIFDLLQPNLEQLPASLRNPTDGAVGVISTLVLEHIPLQQYFAAASAIMRAGAYLLVTNMHADMGMRSQAGFTDPATGVKIRPTSYCHQIGDVLAVAAEAGFQVENVVGCNEDGVLVRGVDKALGEILGARAKKWVGVRVWFGVCFSKK